jgi:hypothetical protein
LVYDGSMLRDGLDPAAAGAAVTVELCGHWEHEGPCRWPHNSAIETERDPARFRTLFVADEREAELERDRIETALRGDHGWRLVSLRSRPRGGRARSRRAALGGATVGVGSRSTLREDAGVLGDNAAGSRSRRRSGMSPVGLPTPATPDKSGSVPGPGRQLWDAIADRGQSPALLWARVVSASRRTTGARRTSGTASMRRRYSAVSKRTGSGKTSGSRLAAGRNAKRRSRRGTDSRRSPRPRLLGTW